MKKILSLLSAGALALGLIGCSGDLHDTELIDLTGYGVRGTGLESGWDSNSDIPLVDNGDGTYSVKFTATGSASKGGDDFAILECGDGSWNTAYRLAQPKSEGDSANVFTDDNLEQKVYLGQSADCCNIPSTKEGDVVELLITPDATYLTVKVTVTSGGGSTAPTPFHLDGFFVSGSFNGGVSDSSSVLSDPELEKKTGKLTYKTTFTFDAASNANWGQNTASEVSFGIQKSGWATKYTGATFTVGTDTDYVETTSGADANNVVSGLKDGKPYALYIQTLPEGNVSIFVEEVSAVTLKVLVKGIDASEEGKIAVIGGSFDGWSGWTSAWGGTKKYTDMAYGEISDDGTVEITLVKNKAMTIGESISWEACGYWGEPNENGDIATTDGEIKIGGENFKLDFEVKAGTFTYVIDLASDSGEMTFEE